METIEDIRPLIDIPPFWMQIAPYVLGILALAILLYFIVRRYIKIHPVDLVEPKEKKHPLSPYQRAVIEITTARKFMRPGKDKELASQLSNSIRNYLEKAHTLPAPEKTTEEFLHELESSTLFSGTPLDTLNNFLRKCDLAKFAKEEFTAHEQESLCYSAKEFLDLAHGIKNIQPKLESPITSNS